MREGFAILQSRLRRRLMAGFEYLRYGWGDRGPLQNYVVVSCQRNAGKYAIACLTSVYGQDHPRHKIKHVFIDDASDDGTDEQVVAWLAAHPDHNVEYMRNSDRIGGTQNTLRGIARADSTDIVVELNGDDWLPDPRVLTYLNRVYANGAVWMTYNSPRLSSGPAAPWARPVPKKVVASNTFRDQPEWTSSHLHTFRKKLFDHLPMEVMIDPDTGDYWECADDQALYLAMLELAGAHARHIYRVTCVYNYWEASHAYNDGQRSRDLAAKIRRAQRRQPLERLS